MKGIINKGVQDFVTEKFGSESWDRIKSLAGCSEPFFAASHDYPDETTLALVEASSKLSGLSPEEVMVEYGRYVVPNTLKRHYATYLKLAGSSPREFLLNMDRVHSEVTKSIADAKPPRFEYEELPDGRLLMHYHSSRRLCSVLRGLILGVGDLFGQILEVKETSCMQRGADRCTMEVTFP